jgi:hypothetical protein
VFPAFVSLIKMARFHPKFPPARLADPPGGQHTLKSITTTIGALPDDVNAAWTLPSDWACYVNAYPRLPASLKNLPIWASSGPR